MEDDSCVKYIEIVPLDNFRNCSYSLSDVKCGSSQVKVRSKLLLLVSCS